MDRKLYADGFQNFSELRAAELFWVPPSFLQRRLQRGLDTTLGVTEANLYIPRIKNTSLCQIFWNYLHVDSEYV